MLRTDYADYLEKQARDLERRAFICEESGNPAAAANDKREAERLRRRAREMRRSRELRPGVRTA